MCVRPDEDQSQKGKKNKENYFYDYFISSPLICIYATAAAAASMIVSELQPEMFLYICGFNLPFVSGKKRRTDRQTDRNHHQERWPRKFEINSGKNNRHAKLISQQE